MAFSQTAMAPNATGQAIVAPGAFGQNYGAPGGFGQYSPFSIGNLQAQPMAQAFGIPAPLIPIYGTAIGTQSGSTVPKLTARINTTVEANDNYNLQSTSLGNALIWTTTMGLGYATSTVVDSLTADIAGSVRVSDLPVKGGEVTFDNPVFNLHYNRGVNDDFIGFNFYYNRADLNYFQPLIGVNPDGSFDTVSSSGTRETLRSSFSLLLNQNGPISFDLVADTWQLNYYDADPTLTDQSRSNVDAMLGFRLNPLFVATLGAGYRYKVNGNSIHTNITTTRADAGFNADLNQLTTAQFRLGYATVDTENDLGTSTRSSIVGDLSLQSQLKNGNIRGAVFSRIDENGPRLDVTVGRLYQWQYGSLDGTIGGSTSDSTDWRMIGNVAYTYQLQSSRITANFAQLTTVDSQSQNVINTNFTLGYTQKVTNVSSVGIAFLAGLIRYQNSTRDPTERTAVTLSYDRALTPDWTMNFGYRHRFLNSNTTDNANSNAVFMGLNRSFASLD